MSTSCRLSALFHMNCAGMALFLFVLVVLPHAEAKTVYWGRSKKTIVLDPGHGGTDAGAHSSDGTLEKKVVLDLSQQIADRLTGTYRVNLTRSDDYQLDTDRRTDVANNFGADVFVSIHAAGSYASANKGICIYYFEGVAPGEITDSGSQKDSQVSLPVWDHLQLRHIHTSRMLAKNLKDRLAPLSQTTITAAPLLVLRGADMPAVLIEIGYLSNPEDAKALRDPQYLESLTVAIANGIDAFFSDLRQAN